FNGDVVERWMLKTLCGLLASKSIDSRGGHDIPAHWIEILFGETEMPPGCGLFFNYTPGAPFQTERGFSIRILSNPSGPYAAQIILNAKEFILSMVPPPVPRTGTVLQNMIFRPNELFIEYGECKK